MTPTPPKRKEAGVLYATACPACRDELSLGWLPTQVEPPWIVSAVFRRAWPSETREQGLFAGPVTCRCQQVTLRLSPSGSSLRVAVEWTGATEPVLRVLPQYGSIRDQAVAG